MEEQVPKLEAFFDRLDITRDEDDGDDFDNEGEYWEMKNPDKCECWSLHMFPFTDNICFTRKYKGSEPFYPISYEEKIKQISPDDKSKIKIHCITAQTWLTETKQHHFTIVLNSAEGPFYVSNFIESLEPTDYNSEIPELEKKVDIGWYSIEWQEFMQHVRAIIRGLCGSKKEARSEENTKYSTHCLPWPYQSRRRPRISRHT